jgi:hypothetical protein
MKAFLLLVLLSLILPIGLLGGQSQAQSQHRIDEIVLEAKEGFNTDTFKPYGASFKITLRRDGSALFAGKSKVKLIGNYQGAISSEEYEKLVKFTIERDYSRIADDPVGAARISPAAGTEGFSVEDAKPWMITTMIYQDGGHKRISRHTELLPLDRKKVPKALFEIEQAIFDAATRIKWRKVQ